MFVEIERKFLPINDSWRGRAAGESIVQGYLSRSPGRTIRVRLMEKVAFLTIKIRTGESDLARMEFEYPLPVDDARLLLAALSDNEKIEKIRYTFPDCGHTWEVDEFFGCNHGLIVAEVELTSENEAVAKPAWLGEEVTYDPRYSNAQLAQHPFCEWPECPQKHPSLPPQLTRPPHP